jgi:hypothetical protein
MKMSKQKFDNLLRMNHNLLYRSVYGNTYSDESQQMKDVKIYKSENFQSLSYNNNEDYPFLSTEVESFLELKKSYLLNNFPNKTIYEE